MKYLIETPHTEEECLRALDDHLAKGSDVLDKFYFGCMAGDHTGYAIVDAKSDSDARDIIPVSLLDKSRIIELRKFTSEEIKEYHTKTKAA
jgi:hypothetical protein